MNYKDRQFKKLSAELEDPIIMARGAVNYQTKRCYISVVSDIGESQYQYILSQKFPYPICRRKILPLELPDVEKYLPTRRWKTSIR